MSLYFKACIPSNIMPSHLELLWQLIPPKHKLWNSFIVLL